MHEGEAKGNGKHRNRSEKNLVLFIWDPHYSLFRIKSQFLQFYATHNISLYFSSGSFHVCLQSPDWRQY